MQGFFADARRAVGDQQPARRVPLRLLCSPCDEQSAPSTVRVLLFTVGARASWPARSTLVAVGFLGLAEEVAGAAGETSDASGLLTPVAAAPPLALRNYLSANRSTSTPTRARSCWSRFLYNALP